jgi:thioredoxin 1
MEPSEFAERLCQSQRPVVVDLWAPWCGPCMAVKPTLEQLAAEYAGRVDLWQINADESPDLLRAVHVYGIPTLIVYRDGKEARRYVGAKPASALRSMFESLATGQAPAPVGVTTRDRVLRMGAGLAMAIIAWQFSYWPLLILGGLVMFTAVYDRCPIWRAITSGFSRLLNRA